MIKDLCRFFQPRVISYIRFEEKSGHIYFSLKNDSFYVTDLIPNNLKHKNL